MAILNKIVEYKKNEVNDRKSKISISQLENYEFYKRIPYSLKENIIVKKPGIIAEFKRKSPSKGIINDKVKVEEVTSEYVAAGVAGISVLTDSEFFGGKNEDLILARKTNQIPILRKDFIIDEYQIIEAKAIGADVILLIASILEKKRIEELAFFAKNLGLEVLFEIHSKKEIEKINKYVDIVGVNNRNLDTFEVNVNTSIELFDVIPNKFVKISESGISNIQNIKLLMDRGFQGFLIGENFMKTINPGKACEEYIKKINFY
ncbi:MAG: indole-3-glycerol phosphate synthase TrpC [Bacteroidales bacterium]|nr:indole-3-glycerol phosphate synthase TrpC [Bacteroidales bacterium]